MVWEQDILVVLPGLGKPRRVLLQVPQQVWKLWKNRGLMSGDIRVLFSSPLTLLSEFLVLFASLRSTKHKIIAE
jgi:hypothetical protein